MSALSNCIVMTQVKSQLIHELLNLAQKYPDREDELFEFLAFESIELTPEIYNRLKLLDSTVTLIGKTRQPKINHYNPKPKLRSLASPMAWISYMRQSVRYISVKIFLRLLDRTLIMDDNIKAFQISPIIKQNPMYSKPIQESDL